MRLKTWALGKRHLWGKSWVGHLLLCRRSGPYVGVSTTVRVEGHSQNTSWPHVFVWRAAYCTLQQERKAHGSSSRLAPLKGSLIDFRCPAKAEARVMKLEADLGETHQSLEHIQAMGRTWNSDRVKEKGAIRASGKKGPVRITWKQMWHHLVATDTPKEMIDCQPNAVLVGLWKA